MINNSLLVTPVWQTLHETREKNYGRLFEQLFTRHSEVMKEAGSHHRAILYHLGPIRCLVLLEVDAAAPNLDNLVPSASSRNWSTAALTPDAKNILLDIRDQRDRPRSKAEMNLFRSLYDDRFTVPTPRYKPHSTLLRGGMGTCSADTAELVTTTSVGIVSRKLSQMWLGRTPVRKAHPAPFPQAPASYYLPYSCVYVLCR